MLFNSASYTPSILVNVTLNWHGRTQRVVRDQAHMKSTNRFFIYPCNVNQPLLFIFLGKPSVDVLCESSLSVLGELAKFNDTLFDLSGSHFNLTEFVPW